MKICQIDAKDTYPIRNEVLRPGLPADTCHFDGDLDELTFHLGAFIDENLASVASFYFRNHKQFSQEHQYQLRGMATLQEHQHQGLSRALLNSAFPLIKNNHVSLLWCNARVESVGFYEKTGFQTIGEKFMIENVGQHFLMYRNI